MDDQDKVANNRQLKIIIMTSYFHSLFTFSTLRSVMFTYAYYPTLCIKDLFI